MESAKENAHTPVQAVLELVGRAELAGFYRLHPEEAGLAAHAAAHAYLHRYPGEIRQPLHMTALQGFEADRLFSRVAEVMVRWSVFSSKKQVPDHLFSVAAKASTGERGGALPEEWESLVSALETSRPSRSKEFLIALDAAFVARASSCNPVKGAARDTVQLEDLPESVKQFVRIEDPPGEMLGVTEAAERLGVSRPTVYEWMSSRKLVGWPRGTVQGNVIPAEQILGEGSVVPGLDKISRDIGKPQLVWDFLSRPWPFADREQRPIDRLRSNDPDLVQSVLDAAPAYGNSSA